VTLIDNSNNAKADLGVIDISQKEKIIITKKNFDNLFLDFASEGLTTVLYFIFPFFIYT